MQPNPEIEELIALQSLGMAAPEEINRIAGLLAQQGESSSLLREFDDLLAESMALNSLASLPRVLLKEKVMVTTDPACARVVTDPEGRILEISAGFTELCGYRIEEIRGHKPGRFLQGPETDPGSVEKFRAAIRARQPCAVELLNYHKSGSAYWVHIDMHPVVGFGGTLEGFTALEKRLE